MCAVFDHVHDTRASQKSKILRKNDYFFITYFPLFIIKTQIFGNPCLYILFKPPHTRWSSPVFVSHPPAGNTNVFFSSQSVKQFFLFCFLLPLGLTFLYHGELWIKSTWVKLLEPSAVRFNGCFDLGPSEMRLCFWLIVWKDITVST